MKPYKTLVLLSVLLLTSINTMAQTGYIYVHLKHVNEENSPDYSYTLKNSSGTTISSFSLNDQATADNVATSGSYIYVYDVGLGHGTGGDGQLWAVGGSAWGSLNSTSSLSGTVYYRSPGVSTWTSTGITNAKYIDGAYANQFVYVNSSNNVIFWNNGTSTTLYTGGDAWDVTANGNRIAIATGNTGIIKVYSNSYSTTAAPATGGTWTTRATAGNYARLDMNAAGTTIAFVPLNSTTVYTVPVTTGAVTSLGAVGGATYDNDVAYDDNGIIYASSYNSTTGLPGIYSYSNLAWTYEPRSGDVTWVTGGAGHSVFGVQSALTSPAAETIFGRFTNKAGEVYWIDDDRVKSSATKNGNGIMIPVTPGTYTLTETIPSGYDLSRYNIYDPGGVTTGNVGANTITFVVTADEVVFGEYINEKLNPKAIALTCTFQNLQTFDASNSSPILTYTFGNATYGTSLEGTSYHYWAQANAHDGYYYIVKDQSHWFSNSGLTDHTGNNGYFLMVNASFAADEFYRQRVTNLVPGLSYTIAFYAANTSPSATILPNVTYGLQDSLGNLVNQAVTGAITSSSWTKYEFTFTATTSKADLFLQNNNIGGNGNDIAIDDISINPVYPVLAPNTTTPSYINICTNTGYRFFNSTTDGTWLTSDATVASINPLTGSLTGKKAGTAVITYSYTNQIGCTSTSSSSITVSDPPKITASSSMGATMCLNQTDSLYTNFTTTSTGPYTYSWVASPQGSDGLGTSTIQNTSATPTASGAYTFTSTVTDAVGCSSDASVVVTASSNTAPTVTTTGPNTCLGSAITNLKATPSGGSGSYTYAWSSATTGNGLNAGNNTKQSPNPTPAATGNYVYAVVVNDGFCTVSATQNVTVNGLPSVTAASTPSGTFTICKNGEVSLKATPSAGLAPYSYTWSGTPGTHGLVTTNTQNTAASPTANGTYTYTVQVTDANGCTASGNVTDIITIDNSKTAPTVTAGISGTSTVCSGGLVTLTGSLTGGRANYSYVWSGPATLNNPTKTNTTATSYNTTANPTSSGNYTLTVTDANGCIGIGTTPAVTANSAPVVTATSAQAIRCNNQSDSIFATVTGGSGVYSSYAWTHSASSGTDYSTVAPSTGVAALAAGVTFSNNAAKTYTFVMTVTDNIGCVGTGTTTIQAKNVTPPTLSNLITDGVYCLGNSISLTANRSNGSSAYTYQWTGTPANHGVSTATFATNSSNVTTKTATPTAAGSYVYTLTVTDGNGCVVSASTGAQTVNNPITAAATSQSPIFCGTSGTNQLFAIAGGGSGNYTYTWANPTKVNGAGTSTLSSSTIANPVASLSNANSSSSFKYTVTVSDDGGCSTSATTPTIAVGATPSITSISATPSSQCAGPLTTFALSAAVSGGVTPYNYAWRAPTNATVTPANDNTSVSPITATSTAPVAQNYTFSLNIIDGNNCSVSSNTPLYSLGSGPAATLTASNSSICANPATTINLNGTLTTATTGPYTYAWSGKGVVNNTASITTTAVPDSSRTYSLVITDANACKALATAAVTVDQATPSIMAQCNSNAIRLVDNSGSGVSWKWTTTSGGRFYATPDYSLATDSDTSISATPYVRTKGNYTLQIKNAAGCIGSGTFSLTTDPCGNTVLAIDELSFTAIRQANTVQLQWKVLNENNRKHYEIERSTDGVNFVQAGVVTALNTGAGNYRYTDDVAAIGCIKLYYRLKEVSNNGSLNYTKTIQVNCNSNDAAQYVLIVQPNPIVSGGVANIIYSLPTQQGRYQLEIVSTVGKPVYTYVISGYTAGTNTLQVPIAGRLAAGMYFVRIVGEKWVGKTVKLVKQ